MVWHMSVKPVRKTLWLDWPSGHWRRGFTVCLTEKCMCYGEFCDWSIRMVVSLHRLFRDRRHIVVACSDGWVVFGIATDCSLYFNIDGLPWWPSGLWHCHWLPAVSHHCQSSNPSWDMSVFVWSYGAFENHLGIQSYFTKYIRPKKKVVCFL